MSRWDPRMEQTLRHLTEALRGIRTGTVDRGFVESLRVELEDGRTELKRRAAVTAQGDRVLVRPFDAATVPALVKALNAASLGAYAMNPQTIAVPVPALSAEQRARIGKQVKVLGEEARVAIRQIRQDARKAMATRGNVPERAIQESTDRAVDAIDRLVKAKLDEIEGK